MPIRLGVLAALLVAATVWRSGGADLELYEHFGRLALTGNPYRDPGPLGHYADMPPVNLAAFAALVHLGGVAALKAAFVVAGIVAGALAWHRDRRLVAMWFGPATLVAWFVVTEDKPILLVLISAAVLARRPRLVAAACLAAFAYKFVGAIMLPVLLVDLWRRGERRTAAAVAVVSVVVAGVVMAPWFPASLDSLAHRQERMGLEPTHASIGILFGPLWHPWITTAGVVAGVALGVWLGWRGRVGEGMAGAVFVAYMLAPEYGLDRALLVTLPLLLFVRLDTIRLVVFHAAGVVTALMAWATYFGGPWRWLAGDLGTAPHAAWMLTLPTVVAVWFVADLRSGADPNTPEGAVGLVVQAATNVTACGLGVEDHQLNVLARRESDRGERRRHVDGVDVGP